MKELLQACNRIIFAKSTDVKVIGIQKIETELGDKVNVGRDQLLLAWLSKFDT